jgi:dTDP-glucose 4,6-dehydratase
MKLLLTGGTGFFGRSLLRHLDQLSRLNHSQPFSQITVLSRLPVSFCNNYPDLANKSWLNWHEGDILVPNSLPQDDNYHYILHAAANATEVAALKPLQIFRQIVDGTENMLKFASKCGVQRFLFVSSGGAYGPQPNEFLGIPESYQGMPDPLNFLNAYGIAKRQAEHLCAQYGHQFGIDTVIARCFAFVGRDLPRDAHFAIGNFIRDALERPEIIVNGDGTPIRSYMHQSDLAHWLFRLLQQGSSGNAYNVGSDEAISIADLACLVRDIVSPGKHVHVKNKLPTDNFLRHRYVPDISKAKVDLGLEITVPLEQAIRLSIEPVIGNRPLEP